MKVAGSSVEVALTPWAGDSDILTGTSYLEELSASEYAYKDRNNFCILKEDKQQLTVVPIFSSHCTSADMSMRYDGSLSIKDYFSFSIVRNPWDLCVSYFWWTYNNYSLLGNNNQPQQNFDESLQPMSYDTPPILKAKFQTWCESYFNWQEAIEENIFGVVNEGDTVLEAFSRIQESFFMDENIHSFLKFENLQHDFYQVCKKLEVPQSQLLNLKSKIRKSKLSYSDYYNVYTKDLIYNVFQKTIKRFNYKF